MKLLKHLQQGKLLYFANHDFLFSIAENKYYRWLSFGTVTQSIMLKRKPHLLTLPHQYFLILPLLFINNYNITELGLGGGNLSRFIKHYAPDCNLQSVETTQSIVQCFQHYFNPEKKSFSILQLPCEQWLKQHDFSQLDWIIYDLYSENNDQKSELTLLKNLINSLNESAWVSINITTSNATFINKLLLTINTIKKNKSLIYFDVPHYQNTVIHLHPKAIALKNNINLPNHLRCRAIKLWQHRCLDR